MKLSLSILIILFSVSTFGQRKVYVKNANPVDSLYLYGIGINWNYVSSASFENESDISSGQITNTYSAPSFANLGKEKIIINLIEAQGMILNYTERYSDFEIIDSGVSRGNINTSCPTSCQINAPSAASLKSGSNEGVKGYLIGCVTHTKSPYTFKTFIYKYKVRSDIYYSLVTRRI